MNNTDLVKTIIKEMKGNTIEWEDFNGYETVEGYWIGEHIEVMTIEELTNKEELTKTLIKIILNFIDLGLNGKDLLKNNMSYKIYNNLQIPEAKEFYEVIDKEKDYNISFIEYINKTFILELIDSTEFNNGTTTINIINLRYDLHTKKMELYITITLAQ